MPFYGRSKTWGVERGEREHRAVGPGASGGLRLCSGEPLPRAGPGGRGEEGAEPAVTRRGLAPLLRPAGAGLRLHPAALDGLLARAPQNSVPEEGAQRAAEAGAEQAPPEAARAVLASAAPCLQPRPTKDPSHVWDRDPGPAFPRAGVRPGGRGNVVAAFADGAAGPGALGILSPVPREDASLAFKVATVRGDGLPLPGRPGLRVGKGPSLAGLGCSGSVLQVAVAPSWGHGPQWFAVRSTGAVDVGCVDCERAFASGGDGAGTDICESVAMVGSMPLKPPPHVATHTRHVAWNPLWAQLAVLTAGGSANGEDAAVRAVHVGSARWKGGDAVRVPGSEVVEFTGHPFVLLSAGRRVGVTAVDMRTSAAASSASTLGHESPFADCVTSAAVGRAGGGELLAAASGAQILLFDPRKLAAPLLVWHSLFVGPCTALTMHCAAGWLPAPAHSDRGEMRGGAVLLGSSRASAAVHAYPFEAMMAAPPGTGGPAALMWDSGAQALGLPHTVPSAECRATRPWYPDRLSAHGLLRGDEDGERGLNGHAVVALGCIGGHAGCASGLMLCSQDRRGSVLVEEYRGVLEDLDAAAGSRQGHPEKTFGPLPSHAHPAWAANPEQVRELPLELHSEELSRVRPPWLAASGRPPTGASSIFGDRPARPAITLVFELGREGGAPTTSRPADPQTMQTAAARIPAAGVAPLGGIEGDVLDAARALVVAPAALRQAPALGSGGRAPGRLIEKLKEMWRGEGPPPGSPGPLHQSQPAPLGRTAAFGSRPASQPSPGGPASQPSPGPVAATQPAPRSAARRAPKVCDYCRRQLPAEHFVFQGKRRKACQECILAQRERETRASQGPAPEGF